MTQFAEAADAMNPLFYKNFPLVQPSTGNIFYVVMWNSYRPDIGGMNGLTIPSSILLDIGSQLVTGSFKTVEGVDAKIKIENYAEGGKKDDLTRLYNKTDHSYLTFKRGTTANPDLWDWHHLFVNGKTQMRKSGVIVLCDTQYTSTAPVPFLPVAVWLFWRAIPHKVELTKLDAGTDELSFEKLVIAPEHVERLSLAMFGILDGLPPSAATLLSGGLGMGMAAGATAALGGFDFDNDDREKRKDYGKEEEEEEDVTLTIEGDVTVNIDTETADTGDGGDGGDETGDGGG